jgi:hypothetical protein
LAQRTAYCGFVFHRLGGGIDLGQSQRLFPLGRANGFELTVGEFPQWHGATILCPLVDALPLS